MEAEFRLCENCTMIRVVAQGYPFSASVIVQTTLPAQACSERPAVRTAAKNKQADGSSPIGAPRPTTSNRLCDVLCDVTAVTDSQICPCTPRCADVASRTVNIGDAQCLCATAATCRINLPTTAIQMRSIRDQWVRGIDPSAPRKLASHRRASNRIFGTVKTANLAPSK